MKGFLLKQMLKKQMKNIPQSEQDKILKIIESDPDFFMEIAKEIQAETEKGLNQMQATQKVMERHRDKLQEIYNRS